jgi:hypothetical protein
MGAPRPTMARCPLVLEVGPVVDSAAAVRGRSVLARRLAGQTLDFEGTAECSYMIVSIRRPGLFR